MADPKLVELLEQSSEAWNRWREQQSVDMQIDLSSADLSYAHLEEADLSYADLSYANLSHTNLIYTNLRAADLSHADLLYANLNYAVLSYAHLRDANLYKARLIDANLSEIDLNHADLSHANLSDANLSHADLSHANLSHTDLSYADLSHANLMHADLSYAEVLGTIFARIDLRMVKGLAKIDHRGPSDITLQTIQLPQDGSTLHFLRGAGISDEWIDFYRAMMMHPIQYHSCFISYSSKDDLIARRLHADLQAQGVRCWFAPEDMKIGDKIRLRIDEAIHLQDKLLLLFSEHALASDWVEDEVEAALEKERRQQREVLFPVRLDDAVMVTNEAWAAKLRHTRHIGDFTHWANPQAYKQAFERLLRDLKAETKGESNG